MGIYYRIKKLWLSGFHIHCSIFFFNFVVLSLKCVCARAFLQLTNYHHCHNPSVFIPNLYDSHFHFTPFCSVPSKVLFLFMWLTQRHEPKSGPWKVETACSCNTSEQNYYPVWCNKPEDCRSSSTWYESLKAFEVRARHFICQVHCVQYFISRAETDAGEAFFNYM